MKTSTTLNLLVGTLALGLASCQVYRPEEWQGSNKILRPKYEVQELEPEYEVVGPMKETFGESGGEILVPIKYNYPESNRADVFRTGPYAGMRKDSFNKVP